MIEFPARYTPSKAPVHVRNECSVDAPLERVWAWLIRAPLWPSYYSNASDVAIDAGGSDLSAGARFTWRTFGVFLRTEVVEFESPHGTDGRIAWIARGIGVEAYHA